MRSNGVPALAASTTSRVASRTSSSASVEVTIAAGRDCSPSAGPLSLVTAAPIASTRSRVSASAAGSPVSCDTTRTSICRPSARRKATARPGSSRGRYSTRFRNPSGTACSTDRVAASYRSASSYHCVASVALIAELMRTAWRPRNDSSRSLATASGSARRSSAWSSRKATTVDGWVATAPNGPGSSASTAAIVRSITGVDIGDRPAAASMGPAISSASRLSVTMSTPAIPPWRPSARRVITPHVFVGTATVTAVSGSSPFAPAIAAASAPSARSGATRDAEIGTQPIVEKACRRVGLASTNAHASSDGRGSIGDQRHGGAGLRRRSGDAVAVSRG